MQTISSFKVYNASAGSGKTFTLVKEYLKILLLSSDVFIFQKILAITFTNKAAAEMKERVLLSLELFSKGEENDLLHKILIETSLEKSVIVNRSEKILTAILQNYTAFSITTIDSFTHKIIRSFAFDLGLSHNFEVQLETNTFLNEAIDLLISRIGSNKKLTDLLVNYSLEKIDDDTSWDISNELNEFAKILFYENDIPYFKKLSLKNIDDFLVLKSTIYSDLKEIKNTINKIGESGLNLIENNGLEPKNFTRQTIPKFFLDLKENRYEKKFTSRLETLNKAFINKHFYNKNTKPDIANIIDTIATELEDYFSQFKELYCKFLLYELTLKSIVPLAVLNFINTELESLKEENNICFNAEFNQLISEEIKNQPTPFIYEKIGQRYLNYFIDEMQDTSFLQWQNLIPLIGNALSQENSSLLLVGDAKQAIYRWRGGQAEQFIGLGTTSYTPYSITQEVHHLDTNYRSYSEVINFNNSFFKHVANFLQNSNYKNLYLDGNNQLVNNKQGGFVSLSFLEKESFKENNELRFAKKVLEKINYLKEDFLLSELCVLVRKRKDGVLIAKYLLENNIDVVSSETLLLKNDLKISFIIHILRFLNEPNDNETRFEILYFLHNHLSIFGSKHLFFEKHLNCNHQNFFNSLEDYSVFFNKAFLESLSFYDKIEEIIRVFSLATTSNVYLQSFLDIVLEQQKPGYGVQDFLNFWEKHQDKLTIAAPDSLNAVHIMTIHKSKGLEFPVVILPCDLDIYRELKPKTWLGNLPPVFKGFDELLVPANKNISYVGETGLSIYNKQREYLELDNFNLLYVALTRAVEQLYIITDKKLNSTTNLENLSWYSGVFINYLKQINLWNDDKLEYTFGVNKRVSKKTLVEITTEVHQKFISSSQKNQTKAMLEDAEISWGDVNLNAKDLGNLVHQILAKIYTNKDLEREVNRIHSYSNISDIDLRFLKHSLLGVVNHPTLKNYFTEEFTVYNEREILAEDGQLYIPDKLIINKQNKLVILDYKTGLSSKQHHQQLHKYKQVLENMNFKIDKMILVYINDSIEIIQV